MPILKAIINTVFVLYLSFHGFTMYWSALFAVPPTELELECMLWYYDAIMQEWIHLGCYFIALAIWLIIYDNI